MTEKKIPYLLALAPILLLIILLSINVYLYGDDSLGGANQLSLLFSGALATVIGIVYGNTWNNILEGISKSIKSVAPSVIILLLIGALAGTWLLSGIVPAMIYYGLQILSPEIFLFASCIICAIVSLATGSSWTTIATIGIALLGIGQALGLPTGLIGGAIISGAYFGDKTSPLSDTTNLASAMAGTDLFTHIRYMLYTTIPSFVITLIIFLIIGFNYSTEVSSEHINQMLTILSNKFTITPLLFIVPLLVVILIIKKVPAIPSLFIGVLLGALFAVIFQPGIVTQISGENNTKTSIYKGIINSMSGDVNSFDDANKKINNIKMVKYQNTGNYDYISPEDWRKIAPKEISINTSSIKYKEWEKEIRKKWEKGETFEIGYSQAMDFQSKHPARKEAEKRGDLLKSSGMAGMLNTIWLVICAMIFSGAIEVSGLLKRMAEPMINYAKNTGSLIATTAGTCIFFNITTSDQYMSIVVPGRMFSDTYKEKGLAPENLSRTLEDSGTITSVLIPWNSCGAAQSAVLGVATLTYLPFCFFNLLSPIMTIAYGYFEIKIKKLNK